MHSLLPVSGVGRGILLEMQSQRAQEAKDPLRPHTQLPQPEGSLTQPHSGFTDGKNQGPKRRVTQLRFPKTGQAG